MLGCILMFLTVGGPLVFVFYFLAMMAASEFGALAQKIRAHFYAQGSLDA